MTNDTINITSQAMSNAGRIVTQIQRENIDNWGADSDKGKWRAVPPGWLSVRETFPNGSKSTNKQYMDNHTPLKDTNTLYNSIGEIKEETDSEIDVYSGASVIYAKDHIEGKSSSGGPKQLTQRDFAFITQEDIDGRIMNAVHSVFRDNGFKVEGK